MNTIENYNNYNQYNSPVNEKQFIWLAEYGNTNNINACFDYLSEYDFITLNENSLKQIDKDKLSSFGLIGQGYHFKYNTFNGKFEILNTLIKATYYDIDNNIEYEFMNTQNNYKDIIMYWEMAEDYSMSFKVTNRIIMGYHMGYKTQLDNGMYFKAILHCEINKPVYITFRIVSDKNINGELRIYKNDNLFERVQTELNKDIAKEFNWNVR